MDACERTCRALQIGPTGPMLTNRLDGPAFSGLTDTPPDTPPLSRPGRQWAPPSPLFPGRSAGPVRADARGRHGTSRGRDQRPPQGGRYTRRTLLLARAYSYCGRCRILTGNVNGDISLKRGFFGRCRRRPCPRWRTMRCLSRHPRHPGIARTGLDGPDHEMVLCAGLCAAGRLRRGHRGLLPEGPRDVRHQCPEGRRLSADVFPCQPGHPARASNLSGLPGLRHGGCRRGRLFARQVRHRDGNAATGAAGQGKQLDRRLDGSSPSSWARCWAAR